MHVNGLENIVRDEWHNSVNVRPEVQLDAFIVMPNHVHGVILLGQNVFVGATGRSPFSAGIPKRSLGSFIGGFKSVTTKRINDLRGTPKAPVWQRNYHDHVIRDENSLTHIREYIQNNPLQWDLDPDNPNRKGDRPVAPTHNAEINRHGERFPHGR
jgi:REP element-mobilizing transposase RayT